MIIVGQLVVVHLVIGVDDVVLLYPLGPLDGEAKFARATIVIGRVDARERREEQHFARQFRRLVIMRAWSRERHEIAVVDAETVDLDVPIVEPAQ